MNFSQRRGFTLIEILVVVAIISILASIIFAQITIGRTKGVDAAKKAQMASVRTAITGMALDTGRVPHNYDCSGASCVINDARPTLAIEDTANPENPSTESGRAYRASMQELVNGKYLPGIPHSPGGAGYTYYDYGPDSAAGGLIGTTLDSSFLSTDGPAGTCRPFASGAGGPFGFLRIPDFVQIFQITKVFAVSPIILDGGGPDSIGFLICSYIDPDTGLWYESTCPPAADHQLCDTSLSQDYCLCNAY